MEITNFGCLALPQAQLSRGHRKVSMSVLSSDARALEGYNVQIQLTHKARRLVFLVRKSSARIFAAIATTAVKSVDLLKGKHYSCVFV